MLQRKNINYNAYHLTMDHWHVKDPCQAESDLDNCVRNARSACVGVWWGGDPGWRSRTGSLILHQTQWSNSKVPRLVEFLPSTNFTMILRPYEARHFHDYLTHPSPIHIIHIIHISLRLHRLAARQRIKSIPSFLLIIPPPAAFSSSG